jgi:hypothetical protein
MTGLRRDMMGGLNSSSEAEGVNGIASDWEAGLEDKEEVGESHSYFLRDVGVGMGGCGKSKDRSVKVKLKESGGLNVVGGCGAGRGEERRQSSVGKTRESLISDTTVACLRFALRERFELASGLLLTELGEEGRDSSSSMMIFKGLLVSRDGRTEVQLRPRIWPWRLSVTSREMTTEKKKVKI